MEQDCINQRNSTTLAYFLVRLAVSNPHWAGILSLRIKKQRHRPVIDRCDLHICAETAVLDAKAQSAAMRHETLVERLGDCGLRGLGKARAAARKVGVERELLDDEERTADIFEREIHLASRVGKDARTTDFLCEALRLFFPVCRPHAQKDEKALSDLARHCAVNGDGGLLHPRHDCPHKLIPSYSKNRANSKTPAK